VPVVSVLGCRDIGEAKQVDGGFAQVGAAVPGQLTGIGRPPITGTLPGGQGRYAGLLMYG